MDGLAFYGIPLSDNIGETPEGYLICRDAVICRTGVQTYRYADLPQAEAMDLGINGQPNDLVKLHREAEDVFDPAFIASLEGKPVTDGHPHRLLDIDIAQQHRKGHMQNVHRGAAALDSGDVPMLADLIITCPSLKSKILGGLRQLSCGYTYHIARDADRILMVEMTGNHVAVLRNGRAGHEARIHDGLPEATPMKLKDFLQAQIAKWQGEHGATAQPSERRSAAELAIAMDSADDAGDLHRRLTLEPNRETRQVSGSRGGGKTARTKEERIKRAYQAAATAIDEGEDEADVRDKLHETLDKILDKKDDEGAQAAEAEATAKTELKELLEEATSDDDDDDDEGEAHDGADGEGDDDEDDEEDEETTKLRNAAAALDGVDGRSGEILPIGTGRRNRGGGDDMGEKLRKLRPVIERSKDRKLHAAFDAAVEHYNRQRRRARYGKDDRTRGVQRNGAGYGTFARAAARVATDSAPVDEVAAAQAAYNRAHPKRRAEQERLDKASQK